MQQFDQPRRIILFQEDSVVDALSDLVALLSHLAHGEDDDYGKTLILIMIRDSLLHLIPRIQDTLKPHQDATLETS